MKIIFMSKSFTLSHIFISLFIVFVESNELCEKLCNDKENCVKDCLFSIENHQKSQNVDMIYKSKGRKSRFFSPNKRNGLSLRFKTEWESPRCGLRRDNEVMSPYRRKAKGKSFRVVGGIDAEKHEFPWIVSIQKRDYYGNYRHFCGGSIINDHFVITAAHCAEKYVGQESEIVLRLGIRNRADTSEGVAMSVIEAIVHEKWNRNKNANDIALLRTTRPIKYSIDSESGNYSINSICLPMANSEPIGKAILAGWGKLGEKIPASHFLQKVDLPKFSLNQCIENYRGQAEVNYNMICYGGRGGQDSCMGDSGGPLMQAKNEKFILIGIVSFGIPCALKGYPGVYTNVAKYIDWINENGFVY